VDLAIDAPFRDTVPNMEKTPGVAISADRAQLTIGAINETKPVQPGDKYAEFVVSLPQGPAKLQTAFHGPDGTERGAYYVYVERL
jgi:hypothetical protein